MTLPSHFHIVLKVKKEEAWAVPLTKVRIRDAVTQHNSIPKVLRVRDLFK